MNEYTYNILESNPSLWLRSLKLLIDELVIAENSQAERHNWHDQNFQKRLMNISEHFATGYRNTNNPIFEAMSGTLNKVINTTMWTFDPTKLDSPVFINWIRQISSILQHCHDLCACELGD